MRTLQPVPTATVFCPPPPPSILYPSFSVSITQLSPDCGLICEATCERIKSKQRKATYFDSTIRLSLGRLSAKRKEADADRETRKRFVQFSLLRGKRGITIDVLCRKTKTTKSNCTYKNILDVSIRFLPPDIRFRQVKLTEYPNKKKPDSINRM